MRLRIGAGICVIGACIAAAIPAISADMPVYRYRLKAGPAAPVAFDVSFPVPPTAEGGQSWSLAPTVNGGTAPYAFSISPALPSGLNFDTTNGSITGTAPAAGNYGTFTVTATDGSGSSDSASFVLEVVAGFEALVPTQTTFGVGQALNEPILASGGTAPYTYAWAPDSAAVPEWLTLEADGKLTGMSESGEWPGLKVTVRDADGAESTTEAFTLKVDPGQLMSWGDNSTGILGRSGFASSPRSVPVPGGTVSWVEQYHAHACAINGSGVTYCWGTGTHGQLGHGQMSTSTEPVAVSLPGGVSRFKTINLGYRSTCALSTSGNAYCWGMEYQGQIGNGNLDTAGSSGRSTPVAVQMNLVPGGVTFKELAGGENRFCALGTDNNAYCWGDGRGGGLGNGVAASVARPTPVTMPSGVKFTSIAGGNNHTCGLGNDGNLWCWGANGYGITDGDQYTPNLVPKAVTKPPGVSSWRSVAKGPTFQHVCAIANTGVLYCWGDNRQGQVGNGSQDSAGGTGVRTPTPVSGGMTFTWVRVGYDGTCAGSTSGGIWCWGRNTYYQIDIASNAAKTTPFRVQGIDSASTATTSILASFAY